MFLMQLYTGVQNDRDDNLTENNVDYELVFLKVVI